MAISITDTISSHPVPKSPEEISSMVLLKTKKESYLETTINNSFFIVAAYFNDSRRQVTKLFAPRPPLPYYSRPVDRDIDRIFNKNVVGVAHILVQLKEANTDSLITAGTSDAMEEGEEPVFTHAEETRQQIRREERKAKKTEEFKIAKGCGSFGGDRNSYDWGGCTDAVTELDLAAIGEVADTVAGSMRVVMVVSVVVSSV
jgi:hypothetical protein